MMLNNKKVTIILSFVIAVCLWTYVVGETNPTITKTFNSIQIKVKNEKVLEEHGLAISDIESELISVTVKGTRNRMNKVLDSDIVAFIDMEEATKGENLMRVHIQTPSYTEYESSSLQKVTVNVEALKTKDIPVKVEYQGAENLEAQPTTLSVSQETVTVKGAESRVDSVESAKAIVDGELVKDHSVAFSIALKAVGKDDEAVPYVTLSPSVVVVETQLVETKEIPIRTNIINNDSPDVERTFEVPETVTVSGSAAALKDLEFIECKPIDISDVTKDSRIPLQFVLPEGVSISDEKQYYVEVTVEAMGVKTLKFSESDIEIIGLADNLSVELGNLEITVTADGKESDLESFDADKVSLIINLEGMTAGRHKVSITVESDEKYGNLKIEPQNISVVITENED